YFSMSLSRFSSRRTWESLAMVESPLSGSGREKVGEKMDGALWVPWNRAATWRARAADRFPRKREPTRLGVGVQGPSRLQPDPSPQLRQLGLAQMTPLALREPIGRDVADRDSDQLEHGVADRLAHAAHLAVEPLR